MKTRILILLTMLLMVLSLTIYAASDRVVTATKLRVMENTNDNDNVTIQAPALSGNWSMTLPTGAGTDKQCLQTNGSGVTSWAFTSLDDLNNVSEAAPVSGDVLNYDGANWVGSQVTNAMVDSSAAISRTKLATAPVNTVVINSGAGIMTSESQLMPVRGGTGVDTSATTGMPVVSAGSWSFSAGLDNLSDVNETSPASGDVLQHNGSNWVGAKATNANIDAAAAIDWTKINKTGSMLNDLDNVNAAPENGQALIYDSTQGQWIAGASGDSSFKLQSYTTGGSDTITIKSGTMFINGLEYATYDGSGTADSDIATDRTMTVSSVSSGTHWVYIDTLATSDVTLSSGSGRIIKAVENGDFYDSTENPYSGTLDMSRYIPIGHYAANGSDITGVFNQAFRYQDSWKNIKLIDDKVHAKAEITTAYTVNTGVFSFLNFNLEEYDTHSAVTPAVGAWTASAGTHATSEWNFSAPRAGKYLISVTLTLDLHNSFDMGESQQLYLTKNGSEISDLAMGQGQTNTSGTTTFTQAAGSATLNLAKGDVIRVIYKQATGANRAIFNDYRSSWITIDELSDSTTSAVLTPTNTYSTRLLNKSDTSCTDGTYKVTFPSWFTRTDYQCGLTYHDASAARDFEVSGAVYDKDTAGYVCLDLSGLSFTTNDYLDVVCGLGPRASAFPVNQSQEKQVALTVTASSCSNWSTVRAIGMAYRTQDGAWRIRNNIRGTSDSLTLCRVSFSGVTFKNTSGFYQACSMSGTGHAEVNPGASTMDMTASAAQTGWSASCDVELESKPTWAEGF